MAKRRLILNEDQLPDFAGVGSGAGSSIFRQEQSKTSDSSNSKILGVLSGGFTYVSAFTSDVNLFSGSRSFDVDAECTANSMYEGRINFRVDSDQVDTSGIIKVQLKIGDYQVITPLGVQIYSSQIYYSFDCRFNIQFYKTSGGSNRIVMYAILLRNTTDDTPLSGTTNVICSINSNHKNNISYNGLEVSGLQDFDILIAGSGVNQVYINNIFCTQIKPNVLSSVSTSPIESTSLTVKFDHRGGYIHGNAGALTGNVLFDFTGEILGEVAFMLHNSSTIPVFPAEARLIQGSYVANTDNYIWFCNTKIASGRIVQITIGQL